MLGIAARMTRSYSTGEPSAVPATQRPRATGPFFSVGGRRFTVRGVTYGTFADSDLGRFPDVEQVKRDFAAMAEAGVNTVRTYTAPPPDILDLAEEHDIMVLAGIWWGDPRTLHPPTAAACAALARRAREAVTATVRERAGHPAVLGYLVGNEITAPVVRWHGRRRVDALLADLYAAGKEADADALLAYANYPTTGFLDTGGFDFDCVNVFLEHEQPFRRYLAQLQVQAGHRPLVIGEMGLDSASHSPAAQAAALEWQLRAAAEAGVAGTCVFSWTDDWWVEGERVDAWRFGITTAERDPKPALDVVAGRHRGEPLGGRTAWPRVSVVVCAYQERETIASCLRSLALLRYPDYEVIVVDDGSTDGTAEIASAFPVRLVRAVHGGLSVARNIGLQAATGEVVAYLDADARADPDWLTHLVVAFDQPDTAAAGGPNLVPPDDPPLAQCIARAPGGPQHVLLDDERAEHVPGCNMAFRRDWLLRAGGFDPRFRTAGDDVDVCWRLLDAGGVIRYRPSAVVWHHPRRRVRDFWRQQVGYGRAEATLVGVHPDRFDPAGHASWRGVVYGPVAGLLGRRRVHVGRYGSAPFQRLYPNPASLSVLGALVAAVAFAPLAMVDVRLAPLAPALVAAVVAACVARGLRAARREGLRRVDGVRIGLLHVLQPVAREVGRLRGRSSAFPDAVRDPYPPLERVERARYAARGVPDEQREAFIEALRDRLRAAGLHTVAAAGDAEADLWGEGRLWWRARVRVYVERGIAYVRVSPGLRRPSAPWLAGGVVLLAWSPVTAAWAAGAVGVLVASGAVVYGGRLRAGLATRGAGGTS